MKDLTQNDQDLILTKTLDKLNLDKSKDFFIAVITKENHPNGATEILHNNSTYYVTIQFGDFVCIYLN